MSHTTMPAASRVCDNSRSAKIFKRYRSTKRNHPRVYTINTKVHDLPKCRIRNSRISHRNTEIFLRCKTKLPQTREQSSALGEKTRVTTALTTSSYYCRDRSFSYGFAPASCVSRSVTRPITPSRQKLVVYHTRCIAATASRPRIIFRHPNPTRFNFIQRRYLEHIEFQRVDPS